MVGFNFVSRFSAVLNSYFVKYITWNTKRHTMGKTYEELLPKVNLRGELVGRRALVVNALVPKALVEVVNSQAGNEYGEDTRKAE